MKFYHGVKAEIKLEVKTNQRAKSFVKTTEALSGGCSACVAVCPRASLSMTVEDAKRFLAS